MKIMKRLFWLLPLLLAMLVTGCLKEENGETIVLMGTESNVKIISEVIPDTLLVFIADTAVMDTLKLDLPTGNTPPNIQGEYMFGPRILYKDNGHHPMANDTVLFRFGGPQAFLTIPISHVFKVGDILIQGNDTTVFQQETTMPIHLGDTWIHGSDTVVCQQEMDTVVYYPNGQHNILVPCDIYGDIKEKGNVLRTKSTGAFVVGSGYDFTAYFTVDYDCEEEMSGQEFTLKRGYILTGTLAADGIEHAVLACVNIEAKPANASAVVPGDAIQSMENNIYLYRVKVLGHPDDFGTAVRCDW